MHRSLRIVSMLCVLLTLLSACANTTTVAQTPATPAPTALPPTSEPPPPTTPPTLADNVRIAGVDVGGLTDEEAAQKVEQTLMPTLRPLELQAGDASATLAPDAIDLTLPTDVLIEAARSAAPGASIPLEVRYDKQKLRTALEELAQRADQPATLTVISATDEISRSFAILPGQRLNIDAALERVAERLVAPGSPRRVTLPLTQTIELPTPPTPEQLQAQIEAMAEQWRSVVGIYVYDLDAEQVVAQLNQDSVFSGASVMKVPIMLHSYIRLPHFTPKQEGWMEKMIVESDNMAANMLLAASVGGQGTENALDGVLEMTELLRDLGLEHTYQYTPYEATEYLVNLRGFKLRNGPPREGPAPYTDPDPKLRTTPAEMSRVFLWIEQCSRGQGLLLEKFGDSLTPARCGEMLDRLEDNGDRTRLVAGLPKGVAVAHKSGWIEDMQADIGLIRTPGSRFLMAIYLYTEIIPGKNYLADEIAAPVIADFARLIYSYYHPIVLDDQATSRALRPAG